MVTTIYKTHVVPTTGYLLFLAFPNFLTFSRVNSPYLHYSLLRMNENRANRKNANRLFDSQNNNKGGYNTGDRLDKRANKEERRQYSMVIAGDHDQDNILYTGNRVPIIERLSELVLRYMRSEMYIRLTFDGVHYI